MAVRTRFFDEFFTSAADSGVQQAVILASGLDTRAYRLPWPDGMVGLRDRPAPGHRIQDRDARRPRRRTDRGAAHRSPSICAKTGRPRLRAGGFDVDQPTAWSAEGLLPYLPPDAQDRLFDNITALSAPGSRLATEHVPDPSAFIEERLQQISERWRSFGFDLNAADLFYQSASAAVVADYLTEHGWQVDAHPRQGALRPQRLSIPRGRDDGCVRRR